MQQKVLFFANELTAEQRRAAELLLGHGIADDEIVSIASLPRPVIREGLRGQAREDAFDRFEACVQETASRAAGVPDDEIEAAIDEAVAYVRQHRE